MARRRRRTIIEAVEALIPERMTEFEIIEARPRSPGWVVVEYEIRSSRGREESASS